MANEQIDTGKNIERLEKLVTGTVPILDNSRHGWWRLAVLLFCAGATVSMVAIAYKFDPNISRVPSVSPSPAVSKGKKPQDDCVQGDGQFLDREGSCW
jgi:hypothetical protein